MPTTRVLVVDDSVVVRRLVHAALSREPSIEVVGVAANGRIAVQKVEQLAPDVVTMDVEMPEMDGIEAVRALRAAGHRQPIIMFSTLTERGARSTLDALAAGATDYVAKPTGTGTVAQSVDEVAAQLVPRVLALGGRAAPAPARAPAAPAVPAPPRPPAPHGVELVLVGASTGGPAALTRLLEGLPLLDVPVAVVQHMPPVFTRQLAGRLDRVGPWSVVEVADEEVLRPGRVHIAPGDRHLEVRRVAGGLVARLTDGPPVNFCRPAVDVLLGSAVDAVGGRTLAVVLTGMGADGRTGAGRVVAAGGTVLAQDRATSVVWGMPGAVVAAGYAHHVLPLDDLAPAVARAVQTRTGGAR
ncbi:MAG: chemotaxis response regulator protein-glutamate methylesterase [Cellulomonas sp.]|uniref:protein-glutamate methylesterase/protein-glutamine glutaminase n=1 Tax=Cellulomonas sp. TaxID=40001 RepID=UPI0019FA30AF|nr:chemotaxis response regulator protein-glutamate methylesterase [Cellulomonas sp.]MBF0689163.1 chemotaxis response regulator protein-glutamate methylesterase [Cellulomonas sp.]